MCWREQSKESLRYSVSKSRSSFISLVVAFATLSFCGVGAAQSDKKIIHKAEALKAVEVVSVPQWREVVSPEGRFRVLFPVEPQVDDDVISVKGWRVKSGDSRWVANFSDIGAAVTADDRSMREAHNRGIAAIVKEGDKVLLQRDLLLNGRVGREIVIARKGKIDYMRTFLSRGRVYVLAVNRNLGAVDGAAIPGDVLQFFNSFAYWDVD
jgi:hypothetical protein